MASRGGRWEAPEERRWGLTYRYLLPCWWSSPVLSTSRDRQAACAAVMVEAVLAALAGFPELHYPRHQPSYTRSRYFDVGFGYRPAMWAVDALAAEGLVGHERARPCASGGFRSTLSATPALLALLPGDAWSRAARRPCETVRLKDAAKQLQDYRDTPATRAWRREMAEVNEALRGLRLGLAGACDDGGVLRLTLPAGDGKPERRVALTPLPSEAYRVFNNGDWDQGGRLYDGGRVQNLPKDARQRLTVGGEPVVEEDFQHLHPTLLYAAAGAALDGDAYDVPGFPRPFAKVAFNALLNAGTYQAARLALEHHEARPPGADIPALVRALKARHPAVAGRFHQGFGLRLQRHDSDLALAVLARLRRQGIAALPVHDSFVVPARHRGALEEAMTDELAATLRRLA